MPRSGWLRVLVQRVPANGSTQQVQVGELPIPPGAAAGPGRVDKQRNASSDTETLPDADADCDLRGDADARADAP
jgi:hypothetical protein